MTEMDWVYLLFSVVGASIGGFIIGFVAFGFGVKHGIDMTFARLEAEGKITRNK